MNATFNAIELESRITQCRVNYAPHDEAYAQLKHRIDMALYHGYSGACAITGDTGKGKTTLIERALADNTREETEEGSRIPVIYHQLTAKPTFIGIMQGLLKAYGVFYSKRDTEEQLFELLKTQIKECGTRVIFIDDAQHFVEEGRRVSVSTAADQMKVLIDVGVLVVFIGMPYLLTMFNINPQLRRRFSTRIHLSPVKNKKDSVMMLRDTVKELLTQSESGLTVDHLKEEFWVRSLLATNGSIAYLNTLVSAAAAAAFRNKHKKVAQTDFESAFQSSIFHDATPDRNPFSSKFDFKALTHEGEPFAQMEEPA